MLLEKQLLSTVFCNSLTKQSSVPAEFSKGTYKRKTALSYGLKALYCPREFRKSSSNMTFLTHMIFM